MNSYSPDMKQTEAFPEQTGQEAERELNQAPAGPGSQAAACGADPAGSGNPADALQTVSAGIRSGISPLQFMDSIDAGGRRLGNRAFMHWVGQAHADRQERNTREIAAQAALRGESAQPLPDRVSAAPVQVDAAPAGATAPVQMMRSSRRRNDGPGEEDASGDNAPAQEEAAGGPAGPIGNTDGSPVADADTVLEQLEQSVTQVSQEMGALAEQLGVQSPAGGDIGPQQVGDVIGDASGDDMSALSTVSEEIQQVTGDQQSPDIEVIGEVIGEAPAEMGQEEQAGGFPARCLANIFPDAQPAKGDKRKPRDRYLAYFFPAVRYFYNHLTNRAGQVRTDEHAALSLPGIGNSLLTVLLGLLMAGVALPLDILINLLGVIAICLTLLSHICLGKPAYWLLKRYLKKHPPSEDDTKRVKSTAVPKGPPKGVDWNVSAPEMIATSAISGYFQASGTQGSLSPRLWLQPWTAARISAIVFQIIFSNIVYIGQFSFSPLISKELFQDRFHWSEIASGLFISIWLTILDTVIKYIISYLTNIQVAVYLQFQNYIVDDEMTSAEATASIIGYAAAGMVIQILSTTLFIHFVNKRVNEKTLIPWRKEFLVIHNRLYRTIAIALASFRNTIFNIMVLTLTLGQIAANIVGPLSNRFGQGGACFWPLAVAEVCGAPPAEEELDKRMERIEAGEDNMAFGQVFAVQIFPWLFGLITLGVPLGFVIAQCWRTRGAGNAQPGPGGEQGGAAVPGGDTGAGAARTRGGASPVRGEIPLVVIEERYGPEPSASIRPGASSSPTGLTGATPAPTSQVSAATHASPTRTGYNPQTPESYSSSAPSMPLPGETQDVSGVFLQIEESLAAQISSLTDEVVAGAHTAAADAAAMAGAVVEEGVPVIPHHVEAGPGAPPPYAETPSEGSMTISEQPMTSPGAADLTGELGPEASALYSMFLSDSAFTGPEISDIVWGNVGSYHISFEEAANICELLLQNKYQVTHPEETPEPAAGSASGPEPAASVHAGTLPGFTNPEAQEAYEFLSAEDNITLSQVQLILDSYVDSRRITRQEADLIAARVRTVESPGTASPAPVAIPTAATGSDHVPEQLIDVHTDTSLITSEEIAKNLYLWLSSLKPLTSTDVHKILEARVAGGQITRQQAESIAGMLKDKVKSGATSPVSDETQAATTGVVQSPETAAGVHAGAAPGPTSTADVVPDSTSQAPEQIPSGATGSVPGHEPAESDIASAPAIQISPDAHELFGNLLQITHLSSQEMDRILDASVKAGVITADEADRIASLVREEVPLKKPK